MTRNEGVLDRIIRAVLGGVFFYLAFLTQGVFSHGFWHWVAIILGIVMFVTALTGFCPLYKAFGWNTNKKGAE